MTSRESAAFAVGLIAMTPIEQMWPFPLLVRYINGRTWEVQPPYIFHSPRPDVFPSIEMRQPFVTDFASIPRIWWHVMSPTDKRIGLAAVPHDLYYHSPSIDVTREHADQMLRAGMEALGASLFERESCYTVIRLFGRGFLPRIP